MEMLEKMGENSRFEIGEVVRILSPHPLSDKIGVVIAYIGGLHQTVEVQFKDNAKTFVWGEHLEVV